MTKFVYKKQAFFKFSSILLDIVFFSNLPYIFLNNKQKNTKRMVIDVRCVLTIIAEAAINVYLKILKELAKMMFTDVFLVAKNKII